MFSCFSPPPQSRIIRAYYRHIDCQIWARVRAFLTIRLALLLQYTPHSSQDLEVVALSTRHGVDLDDLHFLGSHSFVMPGKTGQVPLPPWGNALAGATGAVLANAIVYPLDVYAKLLVVEKS